MEILNRCVALSRVKSDNEDEFIFEISNEKMDSHGTVFFSDGADITSRYSKNSIVTLGHPGEDEDIDKTIGTSRVWVEDKRVLAQFFPEEGNPEAEKAVRKIRNKTLNMASIRATITDKPFFGDKERGQDPDVMYFPKWMLIDWGLVRHGSNAYTTAVRSMKEELRKEKKEEGGTPESDILNSNKIKAGRQLIKKTIKKWNL